MAILRGTNRDDFLSGTGVADQLYGLSGDDILFGQGGSDSLSGGDGSDVLHGNAGNDTLDGGRGGDLIDGGDGIDTLLFAGVTEGIEVDLRANFARLGNMFDAVAAVENLIGTVAGDSLIGNAATNLLRGLNGDDFLAGDNGADRLLGGHGADHLLGDGGTDRLFGQDGNDEELDGGDGNDLVDGGAGSDGVGGGAGNDTVRGGSGNDRLSGGGDDDVLIGGSDQDQFGYGVFFFESEGLFHDDRDLIADFRQGTDTIAVFNGFEVCEESGCEFVSFDGDDLFLALDSNDSGILDDKDAFIAVRNVTFDGQTARSTVIDIGALIAEVAIVGNNPYAPGTAQITVFGMTILTQDDIWGNP